MGPTSTLFVLCACLLASARAGTFGLRNAEHPDKPGKCLYDDLVIAVGKTVTNHRDCTQLTCREKRSGSKITLSIDGLGCNYPTSWPANCRRVDGDLDKNYPDCCQRLECDGPPEGPVSAVG